MTWQAIVIPSVVIGVLGIFFAFVLAMVAKKFAVPHDVKIDEVSEALPGLNCGGCGFPSCLKYAGAVYTHAHVSLTMCKPGGEAVSNVLASILGREVAASEKMVAQLMSRGGRVWW